MLRRNAENLNNFVQLVFLQFARQLEYKVMIKILKNATIMMIIQSSPRLSLQRSALQCAFQLRYNLKTTCQLLYHTKCQEGLQEIGKNGIECTGKSVKKQRTKTVK